ncbi:MAG: hypothetical protein EBS50_01785 [Sphingomonadaceae bacterium]|nr:hypothetical protein [Sphingomonadaceae bacterium]
MIPRYFATIRCQFDDMAEKQRDLSGAMRVSMPANLVSDIMPPLRPAVDCEFRPLIAAMADKRSRLRQPCLIELGGEGIESKLS